MWSPAPVQIAIAPEEVHVWRVALEQPADRVAGLWETLSERERERAARLRTPRHRDRSVVGHGALRNILARYLGRPAHGIAFRFGRWGKPALAADDGLPDLRFNVTHSEDLALVALAVGRELGIDLEQVRTERPVERLAHRFFSAAEQAAYEALPERDRIEAFFAGWTRKEAYIKAIGRGLTLPLHEFDVSLDPAAPAALLATRHEPGAASRWQFAPLPPCPGHTAALLVEHGPLRLRYWDWTG